MKKINFNKKIVNIFLAFSVFAAMATTPFLSSCSKPITREHITAKAFQTSELNFYNFKKCGVTFSITSPKTKQGSNLLFNSQNFGAFCRTNDPLVEDQEAGMMTGPAFFNDPSNPTTPDISCEGDPLITTNGQTQTVTWPNNKRQPSFFGQYGQIQSSSGVAIQMTVFLVYFAEGVDKKWDNWEYVYTEDGSSPITQITQYFFDSEK